METHPLQAYRIKSGLSLQDMAGLLFVSAATISRIENRKQAVTADRAVEIERATRGDVPRWLALGWPEPAADAHSEAAE